MRSFCWLIPCAVSGFSLSELPAAETPEIDVVIYGDPAAMEDDVPVQDVAYDKLRARLLTDSQVLGVR